MRLLTAVALSAALLSTGACVSTNATMLGGTSAGAALDPNSVVLYRTGSQVPGPYKEIALLNSRGDSAWTDERKMFESMKHEAAKLGANAVILDAVSEPGAGAQVAAAIFGVSAQRRGKAIAILVDGLPKVPAPTKK